MKRFAVGCLLALAGISVAGSVPEVSGHPAACALLARSGNIVLNSHGHLNLAFADAARILTNSNLLPLVQATYAEMLPEGETPEFVINEVSNGIYQYTNQAGQPTRIETVHLYASTNDRIVCIYYSEGRRFFGNYRSVCFIEVRPAGSNEVTFAVSVYARPESGVVRLAAHCMPVKTFFRLKTQELTDLISAICLQILNPISPERTYADQSL